MDMLTVARMFNPAEARLLASRLEAAGFNVFVHSEGAAFATEGFSQAVGGIRLQVPASQAGEARDLVASLSPASVNAATPAAPETVP